MGILDDMRKKIDQIRGEAESPAALQATRAAAEPASAPPAPTFEVPDPLPSVTPAQLYAKMQGGEEIILLDVRMPWDHEGQHPAGATPLPINELAERVGELDPSKRYAVSCYHGHSSQNAVAFLLSRGFTQVENVDGGFSGWAAAGLPIEGKYAS